MKALLELREVVKKTNRGDLETVGNDLQSYLIARENEDHYYKRDYSLTAKGKLLEAIINVLVEELREERRL